MINYDGIATAADAVRRFFYRNENAFPEHIRPQLEAAVATGTSPVDTCSVFARAVYANRDAVPVEAMAIAAGCTDQFYQEGYHQQLDGRALGMRTALRRDSGEAGDWPAADQDPAPDPQFAPPPPPPAAPATAAAEQPAAEGAGA